MTQMRSRFRLRFRYWIYALETACWHAISRLCHREFFLFRPSRHQVVAMVATFARGHIYMKVGNTMWPPPQTFKRCCDGLGDHNTTPFYPISSTSQPYPLINYAIPRILHARTATQLAFCSRKPLRSTLGVTFSQRNRTYRPVGASVFVPMTSLTPFRRRDSTSTSTQGNSERVHRLVGHPYRS
jgi:hypothetical protein